jgi:hypothetical protein
MESVFHYRKNIIYIILELTTNNNTVFQLFFRNICRWASEIKKRVEPLIPTTADGYSEIHLIRQTAKSDGCF